MRPKRAQSCLPVALCLIVGLAGSGAAAPYGRAVSDRSREPSYGELARSTYRIFEEMIAGLHRFDEATLPHEARALRRTIGAGWSHLDIFAYAYPAGEEDLVPALLATFKYGYDRMGDFKDLFDRQLAGGNKISEVQYDEIEIKRFREPVLGWKREILEPARLRAYRSYLKNPSTRIVFARPKGPLSKCYWGGVHEVPSAERSGYQNLRVLMVALVETLRPKYEQVRDMPGLLDAGPHEVFHGFRVHVRCVLSMVRYFPQLTAEIPGAGAIEDRLEALVEKYGDLNDIITAFNAAESKEQRSRAQKLREAVSTQWSELRNWQGRTRIHEQLEQYGNLLKRPASKKND